MTRRRWPNNLCKAHWPGFSRAQLAAATPTAVAAVLVAVLAALCPASSAAFTARLANGANTAQAAPYFTCAAAAAGDAAFFAYPLAETSGTTAADVSGNNRAGTYQGTLTHTSVPGCARDTAQVATFNGVDAYVATPTQVSDPETFTEETWFKTTVAGGKLMGFGAAQTGASNNYDRHVYLNTTGRLVFGVAPGGGGANIHIVTSPASYTDNAWHDMAATFSPSTGLRLYVDGALVASDATITAAEAYTGYWRIGYDSTTGWPGASSNPYFTGSLAFPAVYTTALTATQIKNHYTAGAPATTTTAAARAAATAAATRPAPRATTTTPTARSTAVPPPPPPAAAKTPRARTTPTPPRTTTHPPLHHPGKKGTTGVKGTTGKTGPTGTPPPPATGTPPPPATGPAPTPAPGPPPPHDTRFTSPTGNITCALSAALVTCTITHHTAITPTTTSCQPGDPWTVALSDTGPATLTCPSTALVTTPPSAEQSAQQPRASTSPAQPLPYGATLTNTTFSCTSARTAMSCYRRSDHHGFHLSRTGLTSKLSRNHNTATALAPGVSQFPGIETANGGGRSWPLARGSAQRCLQNRPCQ